MPRTVAWTKSLLVQSLFVGCWLCTDSAFGQALSNASLSYEDIPAPNNEVLDNNPPPAPPFLRNQRPNSSRRFDDINASFETPTRALESLQKQWARLDEDEDAEIRRLESQLRTLRHLMDRQRRDVRDALAREAEARAIAEHAAEAKSQSSTQLPPSSVSEPDDAVVVPVFPKPRPEPETAPVPPVLTPVPPTDSTLVEANPLDRTIASDITDSTPNEDDNSTLEVASESSAVDSQILKQIADDGDAASDSPNQNHAGDQSSDGDVPPPQPITAGAVDSLLLADNLFGNKKFGLAMEIYLKLAGTELTTDDRVWVTYQVACCSEHLGDIDAAEKNFRTVSNSKESANLASMAQWRLGLIDHQRKLESHILSLNEFLNGVKGQYPQ